jgi:hypothetical protein
VSRKLVHVINPTNSDVSVARMYLYLSSAARISSNIWAPTFCMIRNSKMPTIRVGCVSIQAPAVSSALSNATRTTRSISLIPAALIYMQSDSRVQKNSLRSHHVPMSRSDAHFALPIRTVYGSTICDLTFSRNIPRLM